MSNCAITRATTGGGETCFTKEELLKMAEKYNNNHDDKIKTKQNKTKLFHDLRKAFNCKIKGDACLLETLGLERDTILKPKKPNGKYEWLSTIDLQDVMQQYEKKYRSFLFLGAVPMDFHNIYPSIGNLKLNKTKQNKIGIIFNTQESWLSGEHWISLMVSKKDKTICFFDSTGDPPPPQVQKLIDSLTAQGDYKVIINKTKHQRKDSECGVYSLYFLIERLKGKSCNTIFNKVIRDKAMNEKRTEYFSSQ